MMKRSSLSCPLSIAHRFVVSSALYRRWRGGGQKYWSLALRSCAESESPLSIARKTLEQSGPEGDGEGPGVRS